jgi:glycine cleavage system aminomethyltransferase T
VAKKLVGLRIEGPPDGPHIAPERGPHIARGAKLFSGAREIGEVTSVAQSPRSGTVALGYVHRDFAAPGTAIHVDAASERRPATVTERTDGRSDAAR